jgi:hypothetical protein
MKRFFPNLCFKTSGWSVKRMILNKYRVETLTEIQFYNKKYYIREFCVMTQFFQTQKNKFKVL